MSKNARNSKLTVAIQPIVADGCFALGIASSTVLTALCTMSGGLFFFDRAELTMSMCKKTTGSKIALTVQPIPADGRSVLGWISDSVAWIALTMGHWHFFFFESSKLCLAMGKKATDPKITLTNQPIPANGSLVLGWISNCSGPWIALTAVPTVFIGPQFSIAMSKNARNSKLTVAIQPIVAGAGLIPEGSLAHHWLLSCRPNFRQLQFRFAVGKNALGCKFTVTMQPIAADTRLKPDKR
jgi:hypothetical protein